MKTKLYRIKGWDSDFPIAPKGTSFVHQYGDYYVNITDAHCDGYIAIQRLSDSRRIVELVDNLVEISSSKDLSPNMQYALAEALGWRFITGFQATSYKWTSPFGQSEKELPEELL